MANDKHVALLRQGVEVWNGWRRETDARLRGIVRPTKGFFDPSDLKEGELQWLPWTAKGDFNRADLSEVDLRHAVLSQACCNETRFFRTNFTDAVLTGAGFDRANLSYAVLDRADLTHATLNQARLGHASLSHAVLKRAYLLRADLDDACLVGADLSEADLSDAKLYGANLQGANLTGADLSDCALAYTNLKEANFTDAKLWGADLSSADLTGATLVRADLRSADLTGANLSHADLTGCLVYGVSAWRLKTDGANQKDLVITDDDEPPITVDSIEVAQFIHLLLHNPKIRDVIDTITSKAVLIIGRFTPERKMVLDALRDELGRRKHVPIIFDFAVPASRDVTETIKVLAGLARFVIADITDATEVRVELHNIVPDFTSLAVQPILLRGRSEFISLPHLAKFPWLLPTLEYDDREDGLDGVARTIVDRVERKVTELRGEPVQPMPRRAP